MAATISFPEKELLLRPVTAQNATSINPLMLSCYPSVYQHLWEDQGEWYVDTTFSQEAVLKEIQEETAPYWIVEWKGEASGILRLITEQTCPDLSPDHKALKLHRIYLHPRTHRQGIGRQLMAFVFNYARQNNRDFVWLEAMDTQTDAIKFYEKMQFETTGTFRLSFERMHPHLRGMLRMVATA